MSDSLIAECRLDLAGLKEQAGRYRRLGASVERIERPADGLVVTFGGDVDEDLVAETIAVERECCPFFVLDYQPAARRLSAGVERPEQAAALDALHYALTGRDA